MSIAYVEILKKFTESSNVTAFIKKTKPFYTEMKNAIEETLNGYPFSDDERREMMDAFINAKDSTAFQNTLDRIKSFINTKGPKIHGQNWYMSRMTAAGYPNLGMGYCYGMGNMAAQAFLVKDMSTFNQRLQWMHTIPLEDFRRVPDTSDGVPFFGIIARKKALENKNRRELSIEEQAIIDINLVDLHAFFDGVASYQSPNTFPEVYDQPVYMGQDAEVTKSIVGPTHLDKNKPARIKSMVGAYTPAELALYLTQLKTHLSDQSFVLKLTSSGHYINLNYDKNTKRWLLIDPNLLPGYEYETPDLLAQALFFGFRGVMTPVVNDTLIIYSEIHTTARHEKDLTSGIRHLERDPKWIALQTLTSDDTRHNEQGESIYSLVRCNSEILTLFLEKHAPGTPSFNTIGESIILNILISENATGLTPLVERLIDSGVRPTGNMFIAAHSTGQKNLALSLINHGLKPTFLMLEYAFHTAKDYADFVILQALDLTAMFEMACAHDSKEIATFLLERMTDQHLELTNNMLAAACRVKDNSEMVTRLIDKGLRPTAAMFVTACHQNNQGLQRLLLEKMTESQIERTDNMLAAACGVKGNSEMVTRLIDMGLRPTAAMFVTACHQNDQGLQRLLVEKMTESQTELTDNMLAAACSVKGNLEMVTRLIDMGLRPTESMFLTAYKYGSEDVARLLLDKGLQPTHAMFVTEYKKGYTDLARLLLDKGLQPTEAMFVLARDKHDTNCIKYLLDKGLQPTTFMSTTACDLGYEDIVTLLFDKGLKPTNGMLEIACDRGHTYLAERLLDKGLPPTHAMFITACNQYKIDFAMLLLDKGLQPTEAMFTAALNLKDFRLAKHLFDKGLQPTEAMFLTACIQYNQSTVPNSSIVALLIDKGLRPTEAMFLTACKHGDKRFATLLLDKGFQPTKALFVEAEKANYPILIELLIDKGLRPTEAMFIDMFDRAWTSEQLTTIATLLIENKLQPTEAMFIKIFKKGYPFKNEHRIALAMLLLDNGLKPTVSMLSVASQGSQYGKIADRLKSELTAIEESFESTRGFKKAIHNFKKAFHLEDTPTAGKKTKSKYNPF